MTVKTELAVLRIQEVENQLSNGATIAFKDARS